MFTIERYGRYFAVYENGVLLCVTVYKKGARAVVQRLAPEGKEERDPSGVPDARPDSVVLSSDSVH